MRKTRVRTLHPLLASSEIKDLHPLINDLATCIRYHWGFLPKLEPFPIAPQLESISGQLDGEALFIRNELYSCQGFRKLHLETARLGRGLDILHCVFFPDPCFNLPIFGTDIVASPAGVSAAIFDLSPTDIQLPDLITQYVDAFPTFEYEYPRVLPPWGTIFSPLARFIRPSNTIEESQFLDEINQLLITINKNVRGITKDSINATATINRHQLQLFYCMQQKRNDKTRRVLEKAFTPAWADLYIEELLFDNPLPLA
uniref:Phycocyanobilin:ferredoxin oxidoreductase n=1 Tax=Paulinella micropora TaxID=1928728 RepID=A0A385HZV9_9EUKA|nr:phycocyanobilin:ferredoxin oxidoreductase [Paulinella micropora]AXY63202.1 phycocyanobilin:ferredoxin oxidoreductase [Paulinella micropora]